MPSFLEPDPILLFFATFKEWIYLTVLAVYGLLRYVFSMFREAHALARWAAFLGPGCDRAFCRRALPCADPWHFPRALVPLGRPDRRRRRAAALLGFFLVATAMPGRRFWVLDGLHLLWLLGLIGLWLYAIFS